MSPMTESWSDLPSELLVTIAENHCTRLDFLRLRSICRSWRNAISRDRPGDSSIWSVRIPYPPCGTEIDGDYALTKSSVFYFEYGGANIESERRHGWMVKIEELGPGRLRALDPLSRVRMSGIPKVLNLLDWRVFEIGARSHSLLLLDNKMNLTTVQSRRLIPKKVVMSFVDGYVEEGDILMGIFNRALLLYFHVGDGMWGLQLEPQLPRRTCSDVVFRNARFYAVDGGGMLFIVDRSMNVEIIPWSGVPQLLCEQKYLVEGRGSLYLVVNKKYWPKDVCSEDSAVGRVADEDEISRVRFEVFCLKEEEKEWVQVYSLGELAFFIADDCSFSVVASDYPPYQRNCIYHSDYNMADSLESFHHVFDLEKSYFHQQQDCGGSSTLRCPSNLIFY